MVRLTQGERAVGESFDWTDALRAEPYSTERRTPTCDVPPAIASEPYRQPVAPEFAAERTAQALLPRLESFDRNIAKLAAAMHGDP